MKKIIVLILSILLLSNFTFAKTNTMVNYNQAEKLLLENNSQINIVKKQIEVQTEVIDETIALSEKNKFELDDKDDRYKNALTVFVDPIKAENKLKLLEKELDTLEFNKRIELKEYFNYLFIQKVKIIIQKELVALKEKEVSIIKLKAELGLVTELEVKEINKDLNDALNNLSIMKNEYDIKLSNFQYFMNNDNIAPSIVTNYNDYSLKELSFEEILDYASKFIAEDYDILEYKLENKVLEKNIYVKRNYSYDKDGIEDFKKEMLDNDDEINKRTSDIKYQTLIDYNNLKSKVLDIEILEIQLENLKLELNDSKEKYDLGLIRKTDLNKVKYNYNSKNLERIESILNYQLEKKQFLRYFTMLDS